jgi:hypothetical protein
MNPSNSLESRLRPKIHVPIPENGDSPEMQLRIPSKRNLFAEALMTRIKIFVCVT